MKTVALFPDIKYQLKGLGEYDDFYEKKLNLFPKNKSRANQIQKELFMEKPSRLGKSKGDDMGEDELLRRRMGGNEDRNEEKIVFGKNKMPCGYDDNDNRDQNQKRSYYGKSPINAKTSHQRRMMMLRNNMTTSNSKSNLLESTNHKSNLLNSINKSRSITRSKSKNNSFIDYNDDDTHNNQLSPTKLKSPRKINTQTQIHPRSHSHNNPIINASNKEHNSQNNSKSHPKNNTRYSNIEPSPNSSSPFKKSSTARKPRNDKKNDITNSQHEEYNTPIKDTNDLSKENDSLKSFRKNVYEISKKYDNVNSKVIQNLRKIELVFSKLSTENKDMSNDIKQASLTIGQSSYNEVIASMVDLMKNKQDEYNFLLRAKEEEIMSLQSQLKQQSCTPTIKRHKSFL